MSKVKLFFPEAHTFAPPFIWRVCSTCGVIKELRKFGALAAVDKNACFESGMGRGDRGCLLLGLGLEDRGARIRWPWGICIRGARARSRKNQAPN
ncbi:MAG: Uncharacterised protein [Opitutia bacterium UBA7350]|nr:MAG: Uncharacterised protein [Opitutae bacterium UBA7350]